MVKGINHYTPSQVEQLYKDMKARYEEDEENGLMNKFDPVQLKAVAERVLKRPLKAGINPDVLRATIEHSWRSVTKGAYSADTIGEADDLYFKTTPQKDSLCKRIFRCLDRLTLITHLPLSDIGFPINRGEEITEELRKQDVMACLSHLSKLNFLKSAFTKEDQATIRRYKLEKTIMECRQGVDTLKMQWQEIDLEDAFLASMAVAVTVGLGYLVMTPGWWSTWRHPDDFRNYSLNPRNTSEFCHYDNTVYNLLAQRDAQDQETKDQMDLEISDQYMTCQEYPLWSRLIYIVHNGVFSFGATAATLFVLKKIAQKVFRQKKSVISQQLTAKPEKGLKENQTLSTENEMDILKKRYVTYITDLAKDFIKFSNKVKSATKNSSEALNFQNYQKIAKTLRANASTIEKHFGVLEVKQRSEVMKMLLNASNQVLSV